MQIDPQWAWLAAGAGVLTAFWGTVKNGVEQVKGLLLGTIDIHWNDAESKISAHLMEHTRTFNRAHRSYGTHSTFVRPAKKTLDCAFEDPYQNSVFGLYKKVPVWIFRKTGEHHGRELQIIYLRGTLDPDKLVSDAVDEYNQKQEVIEGSSVLRYSITIVSGIASFMKTQKKPGEEDSFGHPDGGDDVDWVISKRWLKWKAIDLGSPIENGAKLLDIISMPPDLDHPIQELERWLKSKDWYYERHIPWRRGWLLRGKPGTGKTTLIKALAQRFDLPLFVFDLASLTNEELRKEWKEMLTKAPCIALMEDIDAVFEGRTNIVSSNYGGANLSFDCLLNVISGVEDSGGVFTCITTNRPETIDEALASGASGDTNGIASRPGRIDRIVELGPLDEAGRLKMAERILAGYPNDQKRASDEGIGQTPAQFQELCCRLALELFWRDKK